MRLFNETANVEELVSKAPKRLKLFLVVFVLFGRSMKDHSKFLPETAGIARSASCADYQLKSSRRREGLDIFGARNSLLHSEAGNEI